MAVENFQHTRKMVLRNPEKNLILQRWAAVLSRKPSAGAVFAEDGRSLRTFTQVEEESHYWADRFSRYAPGRVIGLQMGNVPEWPAILLGLWKAGHVALPMDFDLSGERRQRAESVCQVSFRIERDIVPIAGEALSDLDPVCDLLKLTSGTSGEPRAIKFSAAQLLADCDNICDTMDLRDDDRNYGAISFAHSYGFSNLITPLLCRGIALVVTKEMMPRAIADGLASSQATVFPGVPAIFRALCGFRFNPNSLRLCISAGAPLLPEVARQFHETWGLKVHSFYGASECGGICYDASEDPAVPAGYVGPTLRNVSIESKADGLIRISSDAVGLGYYPGVESNGVFEPADLLERHEEGYVITGRLSDFINIAGRKVNPAEIERAILAANGVHEVMVFGVPGGARGEDVAVCVVGSILEPDLKRFCANSLPSWQVPRHWYFLEALPVNARGKLSRAELRKKLLG